MLSLRVRKLLTAYKKLKMRAYKNSYDFNFKYDGATVLFAMFKMVRPNKHAGSLYINMNMDTMNMYQSN